MSKIAHIANEIIREVYMDSNILRNSNCVAVILAIFYICLSLFCSMLSQSAEAYISGPKRFCRTSLHDVSLVAQNGLADQTTATHLEAAHRLIQAAGLKASFQATIKDFTAEIVSDVLKDWPDLRSDLELVIKGLSPEFDRQVDEAVDLCASVYASLLSENDVIEIVRFYNSDVGIKYKRALSAGGRIMSSAEGPWKNRLLSKMMTRVIQKMEERGHKF